MWKAERIQRYWQLTNIARVTFGPQQISEMPRSRVEYLQAIVVQDLAIWSHFLSILSINIYSLVIVQGSPT